MAAIWRQVNSISSHIIRINNEKVVFITEDFTYKDEKLSFLNGGNLKENSILVENYTEFLTKKTEEYIFKLLRQLSYEEEEVYKNYLELYEKSTKNAIYISKNGKDRVSKANLDLAKEYEYDLRNHSWIKEKHPYIYVPKHLRDFVSKQIPIWISSTISALNYKKDVNYAVKDDKIMPIDHNNAGVIQANMVWSDGLAQFLQMKEKVPISSESISTNFTSSPRFFKRYCTNLYGLKGTLGNKDTASFF